MLQRKGMNAIDSLCLKGEYLMAMTKHSKEEHKSQDLQRRPLHGRMVSPFEEMEQMLDDVFPRAWLRPFRWGWPSWREMGEPFEGKMPRVDVIDRDDEVVVRAEAPGVSKEDMDVSLTDDAVTIKGSTSHEEKEEKEDFHRREISCGVFSRTIPLPSDVDTEKAKAKFKDGILELTLPKIAKAKRRSLKLE